jgi:formate hydrogenlyase subunit 4
MKYENATPAEVRLAQSPHNLFISAIFLFNLLMTPAVLALKIGMIGLLIPLLLSGALIAYIYLRSKKTTTWFVDMHWKISFSRSKLLMLGYAISATLIFLAWLISLSTKDHNMSHIILTALTRVALVPTVILVLVTAVLEFGSFAQAGKREVPDKLAAKFPPPAA